MLDGCQVVHTDDIRELENPAAWWPALIETVLPITRGERAGFLPSRWGPNRVPEPVEIVLADLFILEGVTASRDVFRPYLTYTIWIDVPPSVRLARGLQRNGGSSRAQWIEWMAGEERYRARERPDERADPGSQATRTCGHRRTARPEQIDKGELPGLSGRSYAQPG